MVCTHRALLKGEGVSILNSIDAETTTNVTAEVLFAGEERPQVAQPFVARQIKRTDLHDWA
jgi:hypothetical protein